MKSIGAVFTQPGLRGVLTLLLTFTTHFHASGQNRVGLVFGSLNTHRELWSQYEREANEDKSHQEEQAKDSRLQGEAQSQLLDARAKLATLKSDLSQPSSLTKGEFETTSEFTSRQNRETSARRERMESELRNAEKSVETAEARSAELKRGWHPAKQAASATSNKIEAPESFFVHVTMGPYNADLQQASGFTIASQTRVANESEGPRIFIVNGSLGGMEVPIPIAQRLREYSDRRQLIALVRATPTSLSFETQLANTVTNKLGITGADVEKGLLTLGAYAAALLGGSQDPVGAAASTRLGLDQSNPNVPGPRTTTTYVPAKIIRGGWLGTGKVVRFYGFDGTDNQWKVIWEVTGA